MFNRLTSKGRQRKSKDMLGLQCKLPTHTSTNNLRCTKSARTPEGGRGLLIIVITLRDCDDISDTHNHSTFISRLVWQENGEGNVSEPYPPNTRKIQMDVNVNSSSHVPHPAGDTAYGPVSILLTVLAAVRGDLARHQLYAIGETTAWTRSFGPFSTPSSCQIVAAVSRRACRAYQEQRPEKC